MDLTSTGLFSLAERRLAWIDQRQQVLAENIANADTPGYQAVDVAPFSAALDSAASLAPSANSARDLPPLPQVDQLAAATAPALTTRPDGNGVSIDAELGKLADTEGMQNLTINLYGAYLGMFRTALGV
jgi:flagellar basal-body rod protein FlgB